MYKHGHTYSGHQQQMQQSDRLSPPERHKLIDNRLRIRSKRRGDLFQILHHQIQLRPLKLNDKLRLNILQQCKMCQWGCLVEMPGSMLAEARNKHNVTLLFAYSHPSQLPEKHAADIACNNCNSQWQMRELKAMVLDLGTVSFSLWSLSPENVIFKLSFQEDSLC